MTKALAISLSQSYSNSQMTDRIVGTVIIFVTTLIGVVLAVIVSLSVLLGVHGGGLLDDYRPFVQLTAWVIILIVPFAAARREWKNHDGQ